MDRAQRQRKRAAVIRDTRVALESFRVACLPAAAVGMADPDKWAPIVERLDDRLRADDTSGYLGDDELQVLETVVREARLGIQRLQTAADRVAKRLSTEPQPQKNEATKLFQAIEGMPYDPRTAEFRGEVKRITRPIYDALSDARVKFGDLTRLLPDEVTTFRRRYPKLRKHFTRIYGPRR